ncbi:hypothetical protein EXIGLDRAFT_771691 [Exidia glandulosa HHB12029]|uniref:F-box domain-containing protein n=1 Tax=Exidia glandulosa HHB12029 TaxID=1314781 RepID=A0A165FTC5_EXIGL|nr:hypothetical protein EXIGLDRAFT_771691 [Exidia glandulosa HHB12029]
MTADRSPFRRVIYGNDDTCTDFDLILSQLRPNPDVAMRISALHAVHARWSYWRPTRDDVLFGLASACPNLEVLSMYLCLRPSVAPQLLAPKFTNLISLVLYMNSAMIVCDIPPPLLILQHMHRLEYLHMNVRRLTVGLDSPQGVHVSGHGFSRDLPFRLKSYQVDSPFAGWLDPLLASVGTIRDIDFMLDAYDQDLPDRGGIHDVHDAFARCGRTVRTLKMRTSTISGGGALRPSDFSSLVATCPRLERLQLDSRGTADDGLLWQTLRALSRPLSHLVVHFHFEDPLGVRQHIRHEQQQYLETMFPRLLRISTLRHLRTLTVLQHVSVLRLTDPYVAILRSHCLEHRIVFELRAG